jgi:sugar/nucleoside kinase (ribokinase family)
MQNYYKFVLLQLNFMFMKEKITETYLCIGHCCHDLVNNNNILGGTASYASIAAQKLGAKAAVLTSVGKDFEFHEVFKSHNIEFHVKKAAKTTVFENIYDKQGKRTQFLHARAAVLKPTNVPEKWLNTPIVQFCMIDDEVDFALLKCFPNSLKGATIQGWLREWDSIGKISPKAMDWAKLSPLDAVIMSDADIAGFEAFLPDIVSAVKIVVMTQGANGAIVYSNQQPVHYPSFPIQEVDATGAGDVFAAAFLIKYGETRDIALATAYAHTAASFVVEGVGIQNLTAMEKIQERFEAYKTMFL